ncbi:hypothetical protein [Mucilaginibacter glaciei]|uniref:Uncharacterized protein n=1 Tax=Mucilaginibacter glaciei TaxID=2772109 RepID=A0A926NPG2_9SPHI|nr:hypothetical protein [Mucilaginibacter glaciei]MBD1392657.1 hypothetical protein [Mucilaginibacter glaciei]
MKFLFITLLIVGGCVAANAQSCLKFKNGVFRSSYNGSSVIIRRMGNYQREDYIDPKASVSFTVTWVDDCTYTLKPNEDYFTRFPNTPKNAQSTIHISYPGVNTYTQTTTSSFGKAPSTAEVTKID